MSGPMFLQKKGLEYFTAEEAQKINDELTRRTGIDGVLIPNQWTLEIIEQYSPFFSQVRELLSEYGLMEVKSTSRE